MKTFALASLAFVLAGCYATHEVEGGPRPDAGPVAVPDGGPRPGDAGPVPIDAGPPVDCRTEIVRDFEPGDHCDAMIDFCVQECSRSMEPGCAEACIERDPTCQRCFYTSIIACANERGCQAQWSDFACCTESVPLCSAATGFERLQCAGPCATEIESWSGCFESLGAMGCLFRAGMICGLEFR